MVTKTIPNLVIGKVLRSLNFYLKFFGLSIDSEVGDKPMCKKIMQVLWFCTLSATFLSIYASAIKHILDEKAHMSKVAIAELMLIMGELRYQEPMVSIFYLIFISKHLWLEFGFT
jgi:hypothetical protein